MYQYVPYFSCQSNYNPTRILYYKNSKCETPSSIFHNDIAPKNNIIFYMPL